MITTILNFRRRKSQQAAEHFARFLELNRERLARLPSRVLTHARIEDASAMRTACMEWLPQLADPNDRQACQAVIDLLSEFEGHSPPCTYCGKPTENNGGPTESTDLCSLVQLRLRQAAKQLLRPYASANGAS